MIIPYGCGRWREEWIRRGPDGTPACVVPHVMVDETDPNPLRLHDGQYFFPTPPPAGIDVPRQLVFVERYLVSRADPWSKAQTRLFELYIAQIRAQIDRAHAELRRTLGPLAEVFDYRAFAFAAPRPLPRAFLALPSGEMVGLHCVFWTGQGTMAIELEGRDSAMASRDKDLSRLEDAGTTVIRVDTGELDRGALPKLFPHFWDGLTLPSGPFKARGIEAYRSVPA